jgi:hypothetical protein
MEAMDLDRALHVVMASPESMREYLADSEWLGDIGLDEVEAVQVDFESLYEQALSRACERLGKPAYDDRSARAAVDEWYPEAIRFAGWTHRDGLVFLALEQHDRETPIALLVGAVTRDEIDELAAPPSVDAQPFGGSATSI